MGGGGLDALFQATLARVGANNEPRDMLEQYPSVTRASPGPIDLERCEFFDMFNADPAAVGGSKAGGGRGKNASKKGRQFDFRLRGDEKQRLVADGFVAAQRLQAESFAEVYYRLYSDDMPVFVTADSVLHAWHRSFDACLVDIEGKMLHPLLKKLLGASLATCREYLASGTKTNSLFHDVEVFLAVALDLLQGGEQDLRCSPESADKIRALREDIDAEVTAAASIFGSSRPVDFSLFKPRGHYTKSEALQRFFRAVTWIGTIDARVAGGEDAESDLYQLQCAVVLVDCLRKAGCLDVIAQVDDAISKLVGDGDIGADGLTPGRLDRLLRQATAGDTDLIATYVSGGGSDADNGTTRANLLALQLLIQESDYSTQLISGHPHVESSSTAAAPTVLPASFALLGQRFVWSSFVFSRLVYDQIARNGVKVPRRIPSAVDVAFTLFGNNVAGEVMAARMNARKHTTDTEDEGDTKEFVRHRDGLPFTSNAIALRQVIDNEFAAVTTGEESASISSLWIQALRELSEPATNSASVFHSRSWLYRSMNTQIASFTQLRHDTVLYAKQSYTLGTRCEYADGMVDPYPAFWVQMKVLAMRMAQIITTLGSASGSSDDLFEDAAVFFTLFANIMESIGDIAVAQAESRALNEQQVSFLKTVMEERFGSGATRYLGWYPQLFYTHPKDSGKQDVLVVDVHTDIPSVEHGDSGGIVHLGVGSVLTGFFVVNNAMYAGPLFSCYEFVTPIDERLTDEEFEDQLPSVSPPDWAKRSFLCEGSSPLQSPLQSVLRPRSRLRPKARSRR